MCKDTCHSQHGKLDIFLIFVVDDQRDHQVWAVSRWPGLG